jgi:enamine deaminase RidA (YjgF/YER057c/UK114 family)
MNRCIDPGWPAWQRFTFSPAIERDGWLFVSGLVALDGEGRVEHRGDLVAQAEQVLEQLGQLLHAAGCSYDDVVATREYVTTLERYRETAALRRRFFRPPYPAATGIVVARLVVEGALFELEAVARVPTADP